LKIINIRKIYSVKYINNRDIYISNCQIFDKISEWGLFLMIKRYLPVICTIIFVASLVFTTSQAQQFNVSRGSEELSHPNIVLVHGAFADGSSWSKVIAQLQEKGYNVTAVQIPLTSLADDVAVTRRVLAMQSGPTILVGHSYGGDVITVAGANESNVTGLVYISAFAPDVGESISELSGQMPVAPGQANIRPDAEGFLWIDPKAFPESFAQDVDPVQARVMSAVQKPIAASIFNEKVTQAAWKSKHSWYMVSENDRMINPDLERFMAKRIGAKEVVSIHASHASMVSHPTDVTKLITDAANATAK
jgi:pimeloyl-ACP methyl ester carboxylesterase